jgi:hypothetical protein
MALVRGAAAAPANQQQHAQLLHPAAAPAGAPYHPSPASVCSSQQPSF